MSKSLEEIAQQLKNTDKNVQLIYAFNGTGKTRLSRAFKELIAPKEEEDSPLKILYYNAFTEDLFYWDNDLDGDTERKLIIRPNGFTRLILKEQGQEQSIIDNFHHYTNEKLMPKFSDDYASVSFSFERGDDNSTAKNVKISKGEESNFIWSVFYTLIEFAISERNIAEIADRSTEQFNALEYIFIDDPVSSLDENHLIQLAIDIAQLIKSSRSNLKFIVTTHNPLFYNVLYNELNKKTCYLLEGFEDGTFALKAKQGDSNSSFSYHLHLIKTIQHAVDSNSIEKYHFTLLRNLYEKTASFLGYTKWSELLPDDKELYLNRVIQFTSHSTLSTEAIAEPSPQEKETVNFLLKHLLDNYSFQQEEANNA